MHGVHFWKRGGDMTTAADFEKAKLFIPAFLKKTLTGDDKVWMTQFMEQRHQQDESQLRQFNEELAWVELTQVQLSAATPAFDTQAGWKKMEFQINQTMKPRKSVSQIIQGLIKAKFATLIDLWRRPMVGVLASAMIVAQMGLLAALVRYVGHSGTQENLVVPASGASQVQGTAMFSVVFKDSATSKDIRELLDANQAQVIGGPGAIGVWVISVPKEKLTQAAKAFAKSAIIESAEPQ
jgi:hypothetical protein